MNELYNLYLELNEKHAIMLKNFIEKLKIALSIYGIGL